MKKNYKAPDAYKLEFDYSDVVTASNGHGDQGHGVGQGGGCDHKPYHGDPKTEHPRYSYVCD